MSEISSPTEIITIITTTIEMTITIIRGETSFRRADLKRNLKK